MRKPAVELAGIFQKHGQRYRQQHRLTRSQLRLMRAIEVCRTAALGGHLEKCTHCPNQRNAYNSCRNRHCPKCQNLERGRWLDSRKAELLPVQYFHVVFTLPQQIARIAFYNQKLLYGLLFQTASQTLLTIAADGKHLGAGIGGFSILHTWGQNLLYHPHLHCVVPGGGLSQDQQRWIGCRPGFFLAVRVLSRLFRRLFLEALERAFQTGKLLFPGEIKPLADPAAWSAYLAPMNELEWVVYAKPPFGGPPQVVEYLGRYTHRVAISNQRLLAIDNEQVTFQWKDYRHKNKQKSRVMTLASDEFLRRFLLHTLPDGFQRIRHFGFLANRHRKQRLALCRQLLSSPMAGLLPQPEQRQALQQSLATQTCLPCSKCKVGMMVRVGVLPPYRWPDAPPDSS